MTKIEICKETITSSDKIIQKGKLKNKLNKNLFKASLNESISNPKITALAVAETAIGKRLDRSFFNTSCHNLANSLLGMLLVRKLTNGVILKGRIVETECYPGGVDKASHSYMGRRTPRNEPMYMDPGTSYVYITYGMYYCFNISSIEPGGAVLIRSVEPVQGFDTMLESRNAARKPTSKQLKAKEVTNGPSKLCTAMAIDKNICNMLDLATSDIFWVESDLYSIDESRRIISTTRIGIESAGPECVEKCFRYYVYGNEYVSRKDTKKEKEMF